jgi:hypothetical protein
MLMMTFLVLWLIPQLWLSEAMCCMSLMTMVRKLIYEVEAHYERDSTAASDRMMVNGADLQLNLGERTVVNGS